MKKLLSRIYFKIKYPSVRLRKGVLVSKQSTFEGYNTIYDNSFFYGRLGFATNIGFNCSISGDVGRFCCIGSDVKTLSFQHPTKKFVSIHPAFYSTLRQSGFTFSNQQKFPDNCFYDENKKIAVKIGNDVWIGSNVVILGGISIGDGAIIGAGAVVTKDVAPYSIVCGVPAKEIRKRFDEKTISYLLNLKWWEKDLEWIRSKACYFDDFEKLKSNLKNE